LSNDHVGNGLEGGSILFAAAASRDGLVLEKKLRKGKASLGDEEDAKADTWFSR
jgi:hypothetical protein